jgi:hypothetical protein
VRVEDHEATADEKILADTAREERRLPAPGLPDNPQVSKTVRGQEAEAVVLAPERGLAEHHEVIALTVRPHGVRKEI